MKLVSVVGVPKPLEAVFSMGEVEREEDKDYSFSRLNYFFIQYGRVDKLTGMPGSTGNPARRTNSVDKNG